MFLHVDQAKEGRTATIDLDGIDHDHWGNDKDKLFRIMKMFLYVSVKRLQDTLEVEWKAHEDAELNKRKRQASQKDSARKRMRIESN